LSPVTTRLEEEGAAADVEGYGFAAGRGGAFAEDSGDVEPGGVSDAVADGSGLRLRWEFV